MSRRPAFFWWTVVLGAALVLCYALAGVELWRHGREGKDYGWWRQFRNGAWYVYSVDPRGAAAGLDRRVGTGAMGAVYRAADLRLGRTVAVKVMVGSLFGNRSALCRFEREARAATVFGGKGYLIG